MQDFIHQPHCTQRFGFQFRQTSTAGDLTVSPGSGFVVGGGRGPYKAMGEKSRADDATGAQLSHEVVGWNCTKVRGCMCSDLIGANWALAV